MKIEINDNGRIYFYNKLNQLDRKNGPAIIDTNTGYMAWIRNGKFHRNGGPAIIGGDGRSMYFKNGKAIPHSKARLEDVNSPKYII